MPKIVIWRPANNKNEAGHVAIATNEYYVSLWSEKCLIKDDNLNSELDVTNISNAAIFIYEVHKGCLVFHQDLDKEDEGGRDPIEYEIDAKVSNEDLNAVIEEFLRYNGIHPEDVTLARGKKKYQEYKELPASLTKEEAHHFKPRQLLDKTKYSVSAELVSSNKDNSAPFYKSHQSCVSFAFNLVQTAWLKSHPGQPVPIVNYEQAKNASETLFSYVIAVVSNIVPSCKESKELPYKVPWFEKQIVRRYLITDEVNNQLIIPAITKYIKLPQMVEFLVSHFVLLLLGYFFPETAYPNLFIYSNFVGEYEVIGDPSIRHFFIIPLLITFFAHNCSCGLVLSVGIFYGGELSYYIMESYLSGEFRGNRNSILVELLFVFRRTVKEFPEYLIEVQAVKDGNMVDFFRLFIDFLRRTH